MNGTKLFCFAYAGGSASIFLGWKKRLSDHLEVVPVEYAGRGSRFSEPLCENIEEMLSDLVKQISIRMDGSPFALFGHSMGSLLAYELAYRLRESFGMLPTHLFASGQSPPHRKECKKMIHALPRDEFMAEVTEIGGTPPQFFEEPDLQELFLPVLRADFKIVETYRFMEKSAPLDCDITVLSGARDDGIQGDLREWEKHTRGKTAFYELDGDHFFIREQEESILNIVRNHIN
ncbi:thioesterase II family protein [Cohnella faecalis]|uniref:Thioesterase n=1 Tax=Cohnella faecalis TaxID=2315694 RepID=A0A398CCB6_9BACL|nr:alpha/beta fold hydrolase [Cohnella faecalis]RIE00816.1 thioesterase [Cohnella faecalis]